MRSIRILAAVAMFALMPLAHSSTGLITACTTAAKEGVMLNASSADRCSTMAYVVPASTTLVAACDAASASCTTANSKWVKYSAVPNASNLLVCTKDVALNAAFSGAGSDPCVSSTKWTVKVSEADGARQFAVTPASGPGPFSVVWNIENGSSCQAAGSPDWNGSVAAAGTKSISPAVGTASLTLVCTVPGETTKGQATMTWVPASQLEDGSAYTNPAGYLLYSGKTNPPSEQVESTLSPGLTRYVFESLDAGTWYFGIKSITTGGVTSSMSAVASKVVTDVTTTKSFSGTNVVTVTAPPVISPPKAPVLSVEP